MKEWIRFRFHAATLEERLRTVDQKLYQAKATGRNTIMPRRVHAEADAVARGFILSPALSSHLRATAIA